MAYKEVKEKAERRFVVLSDISCSRVIRFRELVTWRKRICCHTAFLGFICSFAKKKMLQCWHWNCAAEERGSIFELSDLKWGNVWDTWIQNVMQSLQLICIDGHEGSDDNSVGQVSHTKSYSKVFIKQECEPGKLKWFSAHVDWTNIWTWLTKRYLYTG